VDVAFEILAKTQAARLESDEDMYTITFKLEIDGQPVTFQGQAFIPTVQVDQAMWVSVDVGQELTGEVA
jgi:hypothetical protein